MLKSKKYKFILGITGNIATGKSTVADMFKDKHCLLINVDKLAHRLLLKQSNVYQKIKKCFGLAVFDNHGGVDRERLSRIVFDNKAALVKLNCIMHPELIRQIKRLIRRTNKRIVILDAALIVEAGLTSLVDKLVVVTAKREQQILRSKKSLALVKKQVILRMKSQISQNVKTRFADFIIDNSQQLSTTQKQVSKIRRQLWKS